MARYTASELIAFEDDIAECFNASQIRSPVHLYHGNEEQMIGVFDDHNIGDDDWVLASWRSHYQCLLKGVPPEELKAAIFQNRSISLCFSKQKILSSAIVGGQLPIATGIALGLKRTGTPGRVFCFMGDMTAETGIAYESIKYSRNHKLPIHFIIEDNGKSVCSDTRSTWASQKLSYDGVNDDYITHYQYTLDRYPHAGAGKRVQF